MSFIDDEPIVVKGYDNLDFNRYVKVIDEHVFGRIGDAPFVVGVYGKWGHGKTSLLNLIYEKAKDNDKLIPVKFSPWMYRNEASLLLPLLSAIAEQEDKMLTFLREFGRKFSTLGSQLIKDLATADYAVAKKGLPILNLLINISTIGNSKEKAKGLDSQIREVIEAITTVEGENYHKQIVLFIDDLDRCHDNDQIIGLLEQIKLFLHHPRCIFFIFADRSRVVSAIENRFKGQGAEYLEKFVQLPIEIYPHTSTNNVTTLRLGEDFKSHIPRLARISEVLGNNPREIKTLWNRAFMGSRIVNSVERPTALKIDETRALKLMLKWVLLLKVDIIKKTPTEYLALERAMIAPGVDLTTLFIRMGFKKNNADWVDVFHKDLAVFLQDDVREASFDNSTTLSLIASALGEEVKFSRLKMVEAIINGEKKFEDLSFSNEDLENVVYPGLIFMRCDFSYANLKNADLKSTEFISCTFDGTIFDGAEIDKTKWIGGKGLNAMATEPELYLRIADTVVDCWKETPDVFLTGFDATQLFKMYKTILDSYPVGVSAEIIQRLTDKSEQIKELIRSKIAAALEFQRSVGRILH